MVVHHVELPGSYQHPPPHVQSHFEAEVRDLDILVTPVVALVSLPVSHRRARYVSNVPDEDQRHQWPHLLSRILQIL
jgi:hypothetical protein